ncbi:hypothetical protein [Bradyrhizobium liaoningense]|uniref:hypothetical protein n=1 Tax=Bradyrhizobium liaoningense TaxID=43992 RepID=UPI001BA48D28|nr:hypothetical protein [Bradyrhizobium liaoningense]MBR0712717.1 hypothetical protein [Bradyrhizobium liaoningense]
MLAAIFPFIGFVLSVTATVLVARRVKANGGSRVRSVVFGALVSAGLSVVSDFTLAYAEQGYDHSKEGVVSRAAVAALIGLVIAFFATSKSAMRAAAG